MESPDARPAPRPLPVAGSPLIDAGLVDPIDRRRFLQLLSASLALAGVGCDLSHPPETIVPYVHDPERLVPGRPLFFATQVLFEGWARGVLVESHLGRPTKIEGNPDHPASLGGTDALGQAEVLSLYDPARSRAAHSGNEPSTWSAFERACAPWLAAARNGGGQGLRILTGPTTSPTTLRLLADLLAALPHAHWHVHAPIGQARTEDGARVAFGEALLPVYRVDRADVIVALDCDLLMGLPGSVRHARDFADGRRLLGGVRSMNRLYVVEPTPTVTGASADHRLPLARRDVEPFLVALAGELGLDLPTGGGGQLSDVARAWIVPLARDLERHRGRGLLVVGEAQPPRVHALAHAIGVRLDNLGRTIDLAPPPALAAGLAPGTLRDLAHAMREGQVEWLFVLDTNPVYDAPADLELARALEAVPHTVHLGLLRDETGRRCRWHLPLAHSLESWGDAYAYDQTAGLIQPLIAPLYHGRTVDELLASLLGRAAPNGHALVRETWRAHHRGTELEFEAWWRDALRRGLIPGTGLESHAEHPVDLDAVRAAFAVEASRPEGLELVLQPDPRLRDGRWASNAWLQELPDPITKLVWHPAALVSPALAARLTLADGDVVVLSTGGAELEAPVLVLSGQAEASVTVMLGHGRRAAGQVADGLGYDAYALCTAAAPWAAGRLTLRKTGRTYPLASAQPTWSQHDRHLARDGTLDALRAGSAIETAPPAATPTLFPDQPVVDMAAPQWAMAIDLTTCIGCGACTAACQAENNIPVVGEDLVRKGYLMHWIRVDRYADGPPERPEYTFQPVPCMHCEDAPCELVCPTGATQHSHDGLNDMIYNRCIGTRYCSNNCPYKVRRFNFLDFVAKEDVLALQRNPDVTVRGLGVMEKCTYCVQRIRAAGIDAKKAGRSIREGEVVTACQGACPTRAISFGDLTDPDSAVTSARQEAHHYALLGELNTRPRTTYLARIRNRNPDLPGGSS